ncbi:MAG: crossover junction endodeoxyribonuclease RuvC [Nitrosopumilaceae archaeon]|nr:crossover junction endodeoxyribonuclease RuvC [Nitrosopumilaceae archaeon]
MSLPMVAGIDYSMSCPAICIHPIKPIVNFNDCKVFFYTKETKYKSTFNKNILGIGHIPYESELERFDNISEWALAILQKYNVKQVAIEGYSMGSKGAVFNIGENTGILKHKLWQNDIEFITPAPTTVKKHFSGKGNAKKEAMLDAFDNRFDLDLRTILNYTRKNIESPIGDVVDSVAVVDYLISNYK